MNAIEQQSAHFGTTKLIKDFLANCRAQTTETSKLNDAIDMILRWICCWSVSVCVQLADAAVLLSRRTLL